MIYNFLNFIFSLNRKIKMIVQLCFDASLIFISFLIAMILRLDHIHFINNSDFIYNLIILTFLTLFTFYNLNFYKAVIRFITGKFLKNVFFGVLFSSIFLYLNSF